MKSLSTKLVVRAAWLLSVAIFSLSAWQSLDMHNEHLPGKNIRFLYNQSQAKVIFTAYSPVRFSSIVASIEELQHCEARKSISEVLLVWNSPLPPPVQDQDTFGFAGLLYNKSPSIPVKLHLGNDNSRDNRYKAAFQHSSSNQKLIFVEDSAIINCFSWNQLMHAMDALKSSSLLMKFYIHNKVYQAHQFVSRNTTKAQLNADQVYESHSMTCDSPQEYKDVLLLDDNPPIPEIIIIPPKTIQSYFNQTEYSQFCDSNDVIDYIHSIVHAGTGGASTFNIYLSGDSAISCESKQENEQGRVSVMTANPNIPSFMRTSPVSDYATLRSAERKRNCKRLLLEKWNKVLDESPQAKDATHYFCSIPDRKKDFYINSKSDQKANSRCPSMLTCGNRMVSGVPGDLEVSSVSILHSEEEKTGSRDELPIWKYNRTDEFFEKGVLGPFRSPTLSAKTLNDAFDAMSQHRKRIRMRRTQELRNLHGDKYELQNYYDKYGETDYRIERCYMFDDRCRRLAEDPGIIEIVRKTMNSDDIIVWSMSDFSKANSTIQPWHTDIEPYDRCYNSNVQIWLAVDGVSSKSTLQVMTHSHRFPSATWLFPDHVIHTNKIYQKEAFEKETLLTCAKSLHPGAEITSPVVKNMDFMVLHSNIWHAASDLLQTGQERRKAIRITFAHPKCQIGAVYKYERPDLPPLNPIAMLPPVLLVSGQDHSSFHQKDNLQITNSFLHFTSSSHRTWSQQDLDRRTSRLSSKSPLSEVVVWKTKDELLPLWMNHKKRISKVLLYAGNTKGLFKTLEIAMIRLSPNIANHDAESHLEPSINVIVEGQMAVYTHIEEVAHNGTALAIPSTLMLPKGSVSFVDSNIIHCDISGPQGTWIFNIKYEPHDFLKEKPTKMSLQSFGTPPDDSNFFNIDNSMLLKRVFAKTCRCIHDTHADDDHETVMFIESVPDGVTLYLLPDRTPLEEKAVMYYPLYSSHGIEARNDTTNEVIPYRKRGAIFDLIPRCLVIEFWTPKPNFNQ